MAPKNQHFKSKNTGINLAFPQKLPTFAPEFKNKTAFFSR
jgi:hypothetical protein